MSGTGRDGVYAMQCSSRCGEGQRSRTVRCVSRKRRAVDDQLCLEQGLPRPAAVQPCHGHHCSSSSSSDSQFHWTTSDWSQVCMRTVPFITSPTVHHVPVECGGVLTPGPSSPMGTLGMCPGPPDFFFLFEGPPTGCGEITF